MAVTKSIYQYKFELYYVSGKYAYPIEPMAIRYAFIDYDFEKNFSPITYISLNLDLDMYTKMSKKQGTDKVLLVINKYDVDSPTPAEQTYIKKQLLYFFPNKEVDLDFEQETDLTEAEENKMAYKKTFLGLIDLDAVNRNRIVINDVIKNTTIEALIHKYTNFSIILEPYHNNPTISSLIIPPVETVKQFLNYLNSRYNFYTSDFRYFNDYNYNCLISNKANIIEVKDNIYPTIIINITDDDDSMTEGVLADSKQKVYQINIDTDNFDIQFNNSSIYKTNDIYAVGTDGVKTNQEILYNISNDNKSNNIIKSPSKSKMVRVPENNLGYAKTISRAAYSNNLIVSVSKTDIDSDILRPYKQYNLRFPLEYDGYRGKYILISKKEYYSKEDGANFKCNVIATFRRAE